LREWKLVKDERAFQATEEIAMMLGDNAVVHYRLDKQMAARLLEEWQRNAAHRRAMVTVEAPNLILLGRRGRSGRVIRRPFLHPEWMHATMAGLGIITPEDVFRRRWLGRPKTSRATCRKCRLMCWSIASVSTEYSKRSIRSLREAVAKVGDRPGEVLTELLHHAPWAEQFIDAEWVSDRLGKIGDVEKVENPGVFIETGVAGQSADIVLESEARPEDIAHTSEQEEVKFLGGLHIIGTERHESRRIDNQLRGRAGRQGDPGSSRFYVSLEDELWRLFGVRGQWLLNKWEEDEAVEAGMISKSIERAQKKVELNHFEGRKHVLQYDDVMNVQREVIYRERRRALLGGDLRDYGARHDAAGRAGRSRQELPARCSCRRMGHAQAACGAGRLFGATLVNKHLKMAELEEIHTRDELDERLREVATELYNDRETQLTPEHMRELERWYVTRTIDEYWMEHLAEMDYLRDAIWQEGYAQKEPIGVYRQEGFALFQKMLGEIRRAVTEGLFSYTYEPQQQAVYAGPDMTGMQEARLLQSLPMDEDGADDGVQLFKDADGDDGDDPVMARAAGAFGPATGATQTAQRQAPSRVANGAGNGSANGGGNGNAAVPAGATSTQSGEKVGRNHPCPCGSGKKYKNCCGKDS
jgi:preprotein translocase subunit SecA